MNLLPIKKEMYTPLLITALTLLGSSPDPVHAADTVVYEGRSGPGVGKHIVFLAGDEEYRSEESLPQMARILAERHGFKCTVLFSLDEKDGTINPNASKNLTGAEALDHADAIFMMLRFRQYPDNVMKHFVDAYLAGKPIIALRTSTHAFQYNNPTNSAYARYSHNSKVWPGGFGRQVLGETWVSHLGDNHKEATRGVVDTSLKNDVLLRGVGNIFADTGCYHVNPQPDSTILVRADILAGTTPDAPLHPTKNTPHQPLAWYRVHKNEAGNTNRVFCTTMGSSTDLLDENLRRLLVNSVYWGFNMKVPAKADVRLVGDFQPSAYSFNGFRKGVKPDDLAMPTLTKQAKTGRVLPPKPFGPVPTQRQLRWHEMEFYGFLHFTVNTFTDKEWGYGDESEAVFNPTDFDANQIVKAAKEAGMKGLILTAKHHDGFCLWPSQYTEHSVKKSPWRNGKSDVVKEISEACRRHGLRFGVYLSPWDRNHADYAHPKYLTYYRNQLRELLTNYGDIFTVWFDGANGGDGFYGGAKEKRNIDNTIYYDWENTRKIVRELMPMAVMFSDAGPDMRWVGNERGIAGDPCWATLNAANRYPGGTSDGLNSGERPGTDWIPAECDVSIRPGWFYHAKEDARVKTPAQLLDIYYQSVGRGADLNLNLPPDRRGQIHENDIASLRDFRRILDATFAKDLARGAKLTASNTRGAAKQFAPKNLLDQKRDTYWATDDNVTTPELVIDLGKPTTFNVVSLREYLPLGQRIDAFALDRWQDGRWVEFAKGTSIGNRRLVRGDYITTAKVRLRITQATVCPALSEIGLYAEPGLPKH